jgi:hypothetical protein
MRNHFLFADNVQVPKVSKQVPIEDQIASLEAQRRALVRERDELRAKLGLK